MLRRLDAKVTQLENQVTTLQQQVHQRDEQIRDRDQRIRDLERQIEELRTPPPEQRQQEGRDQRLIGLERQIQELRTLPHQQRQQEERNILGAIYQYICDNPGKTAIMAIIAAGIIGAFLIYMGVGIPVVVKGIVTWRSAQTAAEAAVLVATAASTM